MENRKVTHWSARLIAAVLAFVMVLMNIPAGVFAADTEPMAEETVETTVPETTAPAVDVAIEIPDSLDDLAWENYTYRDIFITNNKAYVDGFNNRSVGAFVQNTGTNVVTTDACWTGPYSLAAFGTPSQQIKSSESLGAAGDYFVASKVYCTRYSVGTLGVCLGSTSVGVQNVTDDFVTASGIVSAEASKNIFIGSIHSADLDGYVDDPVVVSMSIFENAPSEVQMTALYENYVALEKAIVREEVPFTEQEMLDAFMAYLNGKAVSIGLTNSEFTDPVGIANNTTAMDLLRLMAYAHANYAQLDGVWNSKSYTVSVSGQNARQQTVESTVIKPELENYYHILGGKTGTLSAYNARNLAVILEIPDSDDRLAVVALYADGQDVETYNRFEAARQIADAAMIKYNDSAADISAIDVCCGSAVACLIPAEGADLENLQILYAKNPDEQLVPASITKVLTAICALDVLTDMNTEVTYTDFDTQIGGFYGKDFNPGETVTFRDALYAMLLPSSNVTARAVARTVGGVILEEGTHIHSYEETVTKPTCTAEGYTTFTCECGDEVVGRFVPAQHTYEAVVTAPTCTEQGYTTHTCDCGESYVDSYVDATEHSYEKGVCTLCGAEAPSFEGKTVSILSHSASTYAGVSNNTADNSTIGNNDVYYTEGRHGVYRKDTWWQQAIDALGMELLVNNSWSGSCVFMPRKGEASVGYGDRAVNLHNDHTGEEPDIIWVYLGCNDFAYYKDTFGKAADLDYAALIKDNGNGTFTYAEPQTTCEAYAIMLHKVQNRYPDAEIYCMTSTARRETDYTGDSYPDAGQPTEYSAQLQQIATHFGYPVIDLENAIPKEVEIFDKYMGDKRAHPNALGMDQITQALVRTMLGEEVTLFDVSGEYHAVDTDNGAAAAVSGMSYTANLTAQSGYANLDVTVTMGGLDVTETVYSGGTIHIESVTGDLVIHAAGERNPLNFRWEFDGENLVSVGVNENTMTRLGGSTVDGRFVETRYQMEKVIYMNHDQPWVLEWKMTGPWVDEDSTVGKKLFSDNGLQTSAGSVAIGTKSNEEWMSFALDCGSNYLHYGIDLADFDLSLSESHIYRLYNVIGEEGTNMVYLCVDGKELGAMDVLLETGEKSDWVNGRDFSFGYLGTPRYFLDNGVIEYISVWEGGKPSLEGKTISILGDSISTYTGVSNNTAYNSTIGKNAVYYTAGKLNVYREDTWWQQTIDALGMELLVNNSWSGSCILHTRSNTVGAYVDRCVQLHNTAGEEPDIIAVFLGTNDFSYYQSTLGTADIDYDTLITENSDGTFTYATPATSCEAYAIMLHKMTKRYPNADIYCMSLTARRDPDKEDNYADVGQPTAFNAELAKIIDHFGCTVVDLENCGIDKAAATFDQYMGDGRVHPNAEGMDLITRALVSSLMGAETEVYDVSAELTNVTMEGKSTVLSGDGYTAFLTETGGFSGMNVTVTMGGEDITDSCYADGKISIDLVTGDVVITASALEREAKNFRWQFDGSNLISAAEGINEVNNLTKLAGSTTDGVLSQTVYNMDCSVILRHDRPWVMEFRASGSWSGMIFSQEKSAGTAGNAYLFKTTSDSGFIGFGERNGNQYHNYGIALGAQGVDTTQEHTYRLENRIESDGSNMVYLLVDGVDYGTMNHYFIGGTSDQGTTVNWLSGKDLVLSYIGASGHAMNGCTIDYIQVWEDGQPSLEGKTISILGASISTYAGTSNGAAADTTNSTIRNNVKYYPNTTIPDVTLNDTWWMQVANDLDLRLLVNNSWSGSSLLHERNGTVGAYVDRCVQLHDDTGDNAGEMPDIIGIQMGTNDFQYYKDTLGTADIDYAALIQENADGTFTYATPVTSLEAAAIVLHKISVRYPDAEVYYLNISQRVDGTDELIRSFNAELKQVVEHFGAHIVDIYGSAITMEDFDTYIGDGRVHPNKLGMDAYTEAFKKALLENTAYSVETHTVSFDLANVTADYGTDKTIVSGNAFTVNLTAPAGEELSVTVTMGGEDITETAYANGTVTIDAVTADVVITAVGAEHQPKDYRWEFNGTDLVSVGETANALTKNAGTTTDGVFSKTRYALEKAVVLSHDHSWIVEWKSEGTFKNTNSSSGARVFTTTDVNADYNARYIFKSATSWLIAMGEKTTTGSHNYGIALADHGIDGSALHTYRLENRIAEDGSNMIWLYVDGVEIGPMNNYYVGTTSQNTTSDWLSGKDFIFPYMGTDTHGFTNASIEYIQVWEAGMPEIKWEQGTIASATGLNRADTTRLRTVDYLRLSDYSGVGINPGYTMTNFVYDENMVYLGTSSWLGSGISFTTAELQEKYPTGKYFRIALRTLNSATIAAENIAATGVTFYAPGEEIPVPESDVKYEDIMTIGTWQDGAIYDGKLFVLGGSGTGAVYDLATQEKLGSITLDNKDVLNPHANSVCFGSTYYAEGDKYPLLYVNIYNNYSSAEDRMEGTCCVYRVTETDGQFATELVQVIEIGFTEDLTLWKSKESNGDVRPYGNFVVDTDNGKLYAFVMRDAEKTTRFFRFDLPALTAGTYNETYGCNVVTLESADIEAQFDTEYFNYLQGCCYYDGMLISAEGFNSGGSAEPALRIVDLKSGTVEKTYYPAEAGLTKEPEVVCADTLNGVLYYAAADGVLRKLTLEGTHFHTYESVVTAPTCTKQGYTTHTCSTCGDSYVADFVDARGFDWMLEDGEFKILLIGNSFSEDASNAGMPNSQMLDILQAMLGEDISVTVGLCYSGGKGLNWHATQSEQGNKSYSLRVISTENGKWKSYGSYTSANALIWTDWDVVSLQHYEINTTTGKESNAYPEQVDPKFDQLKPATEFMLDYVDQYAPDAAVYFYMHWARAYKPNLNESLATYNKMAAFFPEVLDYSGTDSANRFETIIPVGLSVQNARTTYLATLAYNTTAYADKTLNLNTDAQIGLQRDTGHLSYNIGRYLAALTFAETIIPEALRADGYTLPDIRITESIGKLPKEYTQIVQKAVSAAVDGWKKGSLAVVSIEGYTQDPTVAAAEKLAATTVEISCAVDTDDLQNRISEAALAALPADFAVDAVTLPADFALTEEKQSITATVTIRFGYTSKDVTVTCAVGNDHSYESVVTAPTCTEQGYTTHTCTECGDSYVDSYVDATGHSFGEWKVVDDDTRERICESCGDVDRMYRLTLPTNYAGLVYVESNPSGFYTGTRNVADVLGLKSGTFTNGEVTVTVDGTNITVSGTSAKNLYFDLQTGEFGTPDYKRDVGYSLPDGDYRFGLNGSGAQAPTVCIRYPDGSGNLMTASQSTGVHTVPDVSGADFGVPYLYFPKDTAYDYSGNLVLAMGSNAFYDNQISQVERIHGTGEFTIDGYLWTTDENVEVFGYPVSPAEKENQLVYTPGSKEYIQVYLPQEKGYLQIRMNLANSTSTNAYGWRLDMMYACDDNYNELFPITQSGEYEMAIKLKGRPDFMGMGAHGSERMTSFAIYVDGAEVTLEQLTALTRWESIRMVRHSDLYDPADETTVVARHKVEYHFDRTGLTVDQSVEWLVDETCAISYMMMFPVRRTYENLQITDTYFDNFDSSEYDVSQPDFKTYPANWTPGTTKMTLYSEKSGVTATMESLRTSKLTGTGYKSCSNSSSYNKLYFTICGGGGTEQTVTAGDVWSTSTRYEVAIKNGTDLNKPCIFGHKYESVITAPTCLTGGYTTHSCSVCADAYVDGEVDATGHSYEELVTAPTCEDKGYTTYICSACGDSYVDSYVDATGHKFGDWTVIDEPTCAEHGEERRDCENCNYFETREVVATGHDYEAVVTAPTCTDKGYTTHTCSKCDDSYVDNYVDATGHKFGEWVVADEPTCTEKGQEQRDCANCDHYETRELVATGHDYEAVVTNPTCTEQGYTTHTCANCGDSYIDSYVDAKGHEFGEWTVTNEPTCTEKGEERRACDNCDHFETREVAANEHSYGEVVTVPTCEDKGYTTHTCSECGESYVDSYVDATGHEFGEWVVTSDPTCTQKGQEQRDCDNCDHFETREVDATGHSYEEVVADPTCTEQGYTTYTCSNCGDSYVDSYVDAMGHEFGDWTVTTEPTCTEKGEEHRDCDNCEHYETRELNAKGHSYEETVTAPTCADKGYTSHTCSICGDSYVDSYVDATGHEFGEWVVTSDPTCTQKGQEQRDCDNCDHFETREVDATGHDYKAVVTDPTCTDKGYTTHTCANCGDSYVDNYVDAAGHKFSEWTVTNEPTCTEKGVERRDCENCDHFETREVAATGHSYEEVVTKPTCVNEGYTTHTCSVCGDSYVDSYVDALGHDFENGICGNCGEPEKKYLYGDIDLDGDVDVDDVLALLWYVLFPEEYPITAEADFDANGNVDVDDVLALLWYVLFPEEYPLN